MIRSLPLAAMVLFFAALGTACSSTSSPAATNEGTTAFTKAELQTFVESRCAPCHIAGAEAGMSLATDFTANTVGVASTELPSMNRIKAGDKENSYLFHKISGTHLTVGGKGARMPENGPPYLSDDEIARIGGFIDAL